MLQQVTGCHVLSGGKEARREGRGGGRGGSSEKVEGGRKEGEDEKGVTDSICSGILCSDYCGRAAYVDITEQETVTTGNAHAQTLSRCWTYSTHLVHDHCLHRVAQHSSKLVGQRGLACSLQWQQADLR